LAVFKIDRKGTLLKREEVKKGIREDVGHTTKK